MIGKKTIHQRHIGHRDGGLCEIICRLNEELSEPVLMRIELDSADGASNVVRFLVVAPVRRTIAAGSIQIGSDDVPIGVASNSDEESFSVMLERVPTDSLGVTVQDSIEDEGALSSLLAAVTALALLRVGALEDDLKGLEILYYLGRVDRSNGRSDRPQGSFPDGSIWEFAVQKPEIIRQLKAIQEFLRRHGEAMMDAKLLSP